MELLNKEKTIASNPFTPKSGWEPRVFIGREKEIELFKKKLEEAKQGRGDHFLVLGEWGIGKTSLLKEFKKIAQREGVLTSLVSIRKFKNTEEIIDGVTQLVQDLTKKLPFQIRKLTNFLKYARSLDVKVMGTGIQFSKQIGVDPQVLLLDSLATLWKDLKNKTLVLVILLDDVQNFFAISEIFTLIKNVLSDEGTVENTKFLFGLSCTPEEWKGFLQRHHPIGRYFTPRLKIGRLTKDEVETALNLILKDTNIVFDKNVKEKVYGYTLGHPYELQVLCSKLYDNQIEGKVTDKGWEASLNEALIEVGENVFDGFYNKASKQEKMVLYIITLLESPVKRKDILLLSKKYNLNFSENIVGSALYRLTNKGLLKRLENFEYSLPDRFFKEYLLQVKGYNGRGDTLV